MRAGSEPAQNCRFTGLLFNQDSYISDINPPFLNKPDVMTKTDAAASSSQ